MIKPYFLLLSLGNAGLHCRLELLLKPLVRACSNWFPCMENINLHWDSNPGLWNTEWHGQDCNFMSENCTILWCQLF